MLEHRDLLGNAVFRKPEVFFCEVADRTILSVCHVDVNLDQIDVDVKFEDRFLACPHARGSE